MGKVKSALAGLLLLLVVLSPNARAADAMTLMLQQVERKSTGPSTGLSTLTEVVLESADVVGGIAVRG